MLSYESALEMVQFINFKSNNDWDNFILVYYPRRIDYLYLVPNLPEDIILKRKNAYERGIQFPCTEKTI